jgi:phosphatidylglycerophosphatase A
MTEAPPGRFARLLLTAFGAGLSPLAPGTVASLLTAGLIALAGSRPLLGVAAALACFAYGTVVTLLYGGRAHRPDGRGDPGWVVSDEVAGQAIASAAALAIGGPWAHAAAFVLFRAFDIAKPWPVGPLERVPGGAGVLLDDLAAGAIAGAIVLGAGLAGLFA